MMIDKEGKNMRSFFYLKKLGEKLTFDILDDIRDYVTL